MADNNDINIGELMQAQFAGTEFQIQDNPGDPTFVDTPPTTPAPPADVTPPADAVPPINTPPQDTPTATQPQFDDLLKEKSKGKFTKWEDVESTLNTPKEEFADDLVKQINEYRKTGGKFDKEWLRLQSTDYNSIKNPSELLAEKLKLEEPGITDIEINLAIEERYKLTDWEEGDDSDLAQAMTSKITREADAARKWLIANQEKTSFKPKEVSPEAKQAMEEANKQALDKWSNTVKESVTSIEKMPIKIADDFTVDYVMSNEDKAFMEQIGTQMFSNALAPFQSFIDAKDPSNINVKGMMEFIAKGKMFDSAMKLVAEQAEARGKKAIVTDQKNIDFTPNQQQGAGTGPFTVDDQIGQHFAGKQF